MEDWDVLPDELRQQSLSDEEIILPFDGAIQALEHFEKAQWALLGWEGIIKHRQTGQIGHAHNYQGTVSLNQYDDEAWTDYVKRTADFCRRTIQEDQQRFRQNPEQFENELYFCLSPLELAN